MCRPGRYPFAASRFARSVLCRPVLRVLPLFFSTRLPFSLAEAPSHASSDACEAAKAVISDLRLHSASPAAMAIVATEVAVVGTAVGAAALRFILESYMLDQGLPWGRFTKGYPMAMAKTTMHPDLIRDLAAFTMTKAETYTLHRGRHLRPRLPVDPWPPLRRSPPVAPRVVCSACAGRTSALRSGTSSPSGGWRCT